MNKKLVNLMIIGVIILLMLIFFLNKSNQIDSIDSSGSGSINSQNYGQQTTSGDTEASSSDSTPVVVSSNAGRMVTLTLEALDFNVEFPQYELPKAKVSAGDTVKMRISFLSGTDIPVSTISPTLYIYEGGEVTEEITEGLPEEINGVNAGQTYAYEFTLTIPNSPTDTQYAFGIIIGGCTALGNCGYGAAGINLEVGEGINPANYNSGEIQVAE